MKIINQARTRIKGQQWFDSMSEKHWVSSNDNIMYLLIKPHFKSKELGIPMNELIPIITVAKPSLVCEECKRTYLVYGINDEEIDVTTFEHYSCATCRKRILIRDKRYVSI